MVSLTILALAMTSMSSGDPFASAARRSISDLVGQELLGHYDVETVELLEVKDRDGEIGGPYPGYGLRTVRAAVQAIRNKTWSKSLNPGIPTWPECQRAVQLFVLCRPAGFRLKAEIEVEMVATTDGWRILSRDHRSLRRYPLAKYLICPADKPGATDEEIIGGCFASPPDHSSERRRPVRRGLQGVLLAVEDSDDPLGRLGEPGAELVGEEVRYQDSHRLCRIRGPEGPGARAAGSPTSSPRRLKDRSVSGGRR